MPELNLPSISYREGSGPRINGAMPLLFEVAWEVCNQIGGIYTVIKTKAPAMLDIWGDNYFLVGPYNRESAEIEFEESRPDELFIAPIKTLRDKGLNCYFGSWLIPGKPKVILLDYKQRYGCLDNDKYFLWKDNGIPTAGADWEVNDTVAFGFLLQEFFEAMRQQLQQHKVIVHFHEWMAGVALPRARTQKMPFATVFTTHATLLGRYIASDNQNFYNELPYINPDAAAQRYNIYSRFSVERAAANSADVFTTISDVTAREAKQFLGRQADFILPNGLTVHRFTALHEFQNLHMKYKERINEFVMGHFFPSYSFDLDRTLYFFTSGRYEYRNKGMDLFIEAIFRLNRALKATPNPPTVIAFIITKAATKNINVGALQRHLMFEDLRQNCEEIEQGLGQRVLDAVSRGRLPSYEELLSNDRQVRLKRAIHALKNSRLPLIVTHDMQDDGGDAILRHLRHRHLFNEPDDPVKVVFHPDFITATSPLFNIDYDQFVRGCHLGIFPSYYEPWGYTPLECLALGLPAVTTDLSGFGSYVQNNIKDFEKQGIFVLRRSGVSADNTIDQLTEVLLRFCSLTRRERIELRNTAERQSENFDWSVLVSHFHRAHMEALRRAYKEEVSDLFT
ncbi:MAG: glycosyltransferase [Deltaproteobacteria bacterium]|nr:glycosyltransferase [Deltaproteobacteria bacterium]